LKDNSYVANNHAWDFGGGIYNSLNGTVTLSDGSYISNNTADHNGGGVYNKDGVLTLNDDSHISYNVGDGVHNLTWVVEY